MEISVLIPSHHNPPILQKCINSVVEAASKEPSADVDIIVIAHNQKYDDINCSLPIYIHHVDDPDKKVSIGELRNMAIAKADKECILFVDADDLLTTDAFQIFQYTNTITPSWKVMSSSTALFYDGARVVDALMYSFCTNILVKKDILPSNVFPKWSMYEDSAFRSWIFSLNLGDQLIHTEKPTYRYLGHSGAQGIRTGARFSTPQEFYEQYLAYCRWAIDGGLYSYNLTNLLPVLEMMLDYFTHFGEDATVIQRYWEEAQQRKYNLTTPPIPLIRDTDTAHVTIPDDDEVDGGEFQKDIVHKEKKVSSHLYTLNATFILTPKCNENCSYCWQKQLPCSYQQDDRTEEQIYKDFVECYKKLKKYNPFMTIALMGGEITLLSDELALKILKAIQEREIIIFTNGANPESPFYKDERCTIVRHICNWEENKVPVPVNDRECFCIQIERNKTHPLIKYINNLPQEIRGILSISPTRGREPIEDTLEEMRQVQKETGIEYYPSVYLDNSQIIQGQKFCAKQGLSELQVFCKEKEFTMCCKGEGERTSLEDIAKYKYTTDPQKCLGCSAYLTALKKLACFPPVYTYKK